MARVQRDTVIYFPHYANASEGDTISIITSNFGNDGYAFWFRLLEKLCSSDGHYFDCNNEIKWHLLLAKTNISVEKGLLVVEMLAKLNAIDPDLWAQKVIWCQKLVDNLDEVYRNRRRTPPQKPQVINGKIVLNQSCKNLVKVDVVNSINSVVNPITTPKKEITSTSSTQSRVEYSRVKEINKEKKDGNIDKLNTLDKSDDLNIFEYYEKHIGRITQSLSQKLIDAEGEYTTQWVAEALEIGKKKESCSWAYIEAVLKNAKKVGLSPKEISARGNGHAPKELDEQIIGILNKTEGILSLKFSYRDDEYKHVKHGIELGYTTEDFLGCAKAMKADKYWKDIAIITMKSIVKQMPAFKAGKFKPQPPTESEKRYSIEDYLPKEENP